MGLPGRVYWSHMPLLLCCAVSTRCHHLALQRTCLLTPQLVSAQRHSATVVQFCFCLLT
jgi:hypothetical protein